jgi:NAD(P)-dependent dehydrogenase (short-subunit alcohol dehydrogenase family)
MIKKVALVTGASSGIGEATVLRLLSAGYEVYAAARRVPRMAGLEERGAALICLDLVDETSIIACIERIQRQSGRLDVVVNNAGYGSYGALEDVPMAEARRQMEVNLFGLAHICQLALPIMRQQKSGVIVNITSIGGKLGEPFGSWYHATKFAVEGLSDCLRMEARPFGIDVVVIEPGAIKTEWNKIARDSLISMSGEGAYGTCARRHVAMLASADKGRYASPPAVVADTVLKAVTARNPRPRYAVGGGAKIMLSMRWLLPDRVFDKFMWKMSQGNAK